MKTKTGYECASCGSDYKHEKFYCPNCGSDRIYFYENCGNSGIMSAIKQKHVRTSWFVHSLLYILFDMHEEKAYGEYFTELYKK